MQPSNLIWELQYYSYNTYWCLVFIPFKDKDQNMVSLIKNEPLKVPKTSLFNLQKHALTTSRPARQMLNGLIKLVFTPEELSTCKATSKRDTGKKPLDQKKCSTIRGLFLPINVCISRYCYATDKILFQCHRYENDIQVNLRFLFVFFSNSAINI